jgi:cystathionine beta-lyase
MKDFGGMISFELKNDNVDEAKRVLSSTHLFSWPKAWVVWNH